MESEVDPLATCWKSHMGKTVGPMSSSLDFLKKCLFSKHRKKDGEFAELDVILTHKVRLAVRLRAKSNIGEK